ncbi:hypothetical protein [Xanthomonas nasturtii]|uniref:Lipoprotein n=1 Tax=Xanthomonas nasturtii TaxID=1843581 RepID=A0ABT0LW98_9XANT|nr:hypothetical protein [Xanthomonas nasturtii]MCL1500559.1 hypothetical protein [Xanthomonas nasturtii]MCL1504866.1 hypothetical protein [Xanthomonas nasturtii]MCL1524148.1 hypothetical protein [Xanthomonas nasturtii]MCL1525828.1 hypothetical protein [Xanthomonas nasturtii]MCL1533700.1 hypothetical protein [Xanthomonas nasturtii]
MKTFTTKTFTTFLLVSFSLLLASCGGSTGSGASRLSSSEYLLHNISVWNGAVTIIDPWVSGDRGQSLIADAVALKPLDSYKTALGSQRKALAANAQANSAVASGVPDNAKDLDAKLTAYLKSADAMMAALERVAALPNGYSNTELAPLATDLETASAQLNTDMAALNTAQRAYSAEHKIPMQQVQQ